MSADKHRSRGRRLALLLRAASVEDSRFGILLHGEGGMAMRDPDLRRLLRNGHLRLRRVDRFGLTSPCKRLPPHSHALARHGRIGVTVVRTYAVLTERGRAALGSGLA